MKLYYKLRALQFFTRHPGMLLFAAILWLFGALGKLAWFLLKRPQRAAVAIVTGAAWWQWGWQAGAIALPAALALAATVTVALIAERGTARGLGAILTGVSRRRKVGKAWPHVCQKLRLTNPETGAELPASRWRITQRGIEFDALPGAIGMAEQDFYKLSQKLSSALFVDRVRIKKTFPGVCHVALEWGQHLQGTLPLHMIPEPLGDPRKSLSIGVREDGLPLEIPIARAINVVGLTGAGKSSLAWTIIYRLLKQGIPFRMTIGDPKFVEWKIAADKIDESPIVWKYTNDGDQLGEAGLKPGGFMWQIEHELTAKLKAMPPGIRSLPISEENPLDIRLIDETLPIAKLLKNKGVSHPLGKSIYMGRAGCEWTIFNSQTAEKDVVGVIRDLVPVGMCFAVKTEENVDMALGSGAAKRGAAAHMLDPVADAGVCYISGDDGLFVSGRVGFPTDRDTEFLIMGDLPPDPRELEMANANRQCACYQYYGPDDDGFEEWKYVGIAFDPDERYAQHERQEPEMMAEVTRWEYEWWDNRDIAHAEEVRLITKHRPKWNKQHNAGYYRGGHKVIEMEDAPW